MATSSKAKPYLKLSVAEKLALIDEIWKSIETKNPPAWHRGIVETIRASHLRNPEQVEDLDKVVTELDAGQ